MTNIETEAKKIGATIDIIIQHLYGIDPNEHYTEDELLTSGDYNYDEGYTYELEDMSLEYYYYEYDIA